MARVNVESQALNDARFGVLAGLMGLDDPDFAMGKMTRVWIQCIERETYVLTAPIINSLFGNRRWFPKETDVATLMSENGKRSGLDGVELLLRAELAEPDEAGYRIKGTRGRIEYLAEKRATARKNGAYGGRPPKPTLVSENNLRRGVVETPPAPAPAPAPALINTVLRTAFVAPTVDEVRAYCTSRKSKVDPERFIDHYTANGWVQGRGKPIKDWKACVRTWEKNNFDAPGYFQANADADSEVEFRRLETERVLRESAEREKKLKEQNANT